MGSVAAPHRLAEEAGLAVLAAGGTAVEAAVAVAATLCAVYPHMTGLGGDGFWLVAEKGKSPRAIRACGPAAQSATLDWYAQRNHQGIPPRGPAGALTVAGAVAGWQKALELFPGRAPLALETLLADARRLCYQGISISRSQAHLTKTKADELLDLPGFSETFAPHGIPAEGAHLPLPRLGQVFDRLIDEGLDSFYRGPLARDIAADLADLGTPLALADLESFQATEVAPLSTELSIGTAYNLPLPTQGVASLAILGLFDRVVSDQAESFDHVHRLVEATKAAFTWRDAFASDPDTAPRSPSTALSSDFLDREAGRMDLKRATAWPRPFEDGDTVWFGVADDEGRVVSVIQSIYWEFGAGIVLPRTGLTWQNRGGAFTLTPGPRQLAPGRLPFHTLNPALVRTKDGRTIGYGTMGGEGQPQTQAAFLTRHLWYGQSLADALAAPRWLLGRTWGEDSTTLRLESRFKPEVVQALVSAGHPVEIVEPWDDRMGHAGAVVAYSNGQTDGAHDPRADGGGRNLSRSALWDLNADLQTLARFGSDHGGVTRRLYDSAWSDAREWLSRTWTERGLAVRGDRVGNLYGRLSGTNNGKVILTGSHFDTVRQGGWYDGAYGVLASATALVDLARRFGPPQKTIEVVAFAEEEGSRFPLTYWGSGNLAGKFAADVETTQRDTEGMTLHEAMIRAGFGLDSQPDPRRDDLAAFVEVHIEQGIVLERHQDQIGLVEAIVGQRRALIRLRGEANHAGTTPMGLRKDALAGAAELMTWIESEARRWGDPLVATVGFVEVGPNTPNVVPGHVAFSLDARHTNSVALADFCRTVQEQADRIARDRGLGLDWEPRLSVEPAPMDDRLRDRIRRSCERRGLRVRELPSGAGHDAQVMATQCPTAMLFIPSRGGISHSPWEYSTREALEHGLAVLSDVLYELAWKGESL